MSHILSGVGAKQRADKKKATTFFFDYNTVELTLLFCAVLICLAGVMFESDRFKESDGAGSLRYSWQRDIVTFVVIFIVLASFVYLAIVMANEITGYTPQCLRKCCQKKENAMLSAADTIQNHKDDHIEMSVLNPAMITSMKEEERAEVAVQMAENAEQRKKMEIETIAMVQARRKLEGMVASQKNSGGNGKKRGRGRKGAKNKKREFGASVVKVALTPEEILAVRQGKGNGLLGTTKIKSGKQEVTPTKQRRLSSREVMKQGKVGTTGETKKTGKKAVHHKKAQSFHQHKAADGKVYYSDAVTKKTTWKLPEDAIVL